MACAMGYVLTPALRAEIINELLTQDSSACLFGCGSVALCPFGESFLHRKKRIPE
jgi:hypothetical protein